MNKKIIAVLGCLLLVGVAAAQVMPEEKVYDTGKPLKKPMVMEPFYEFQHARKIPDITFTAPDGKKVSLSDFKGKVLLINVWATWCEPCIQEIPQLIEMQKKLEGTDMKLIAVSVDEDLSTAPNFLAKHNLKDFDTLLDPEQKIDVILPLSSVPTNYVLDGSGNLVAFFRNYLPWDDPDIYPFLMKVAKKYKDK